MKQLIIVEIIKAKPGKRNALKNALLEMVAPSLQEKGCLHYEIAEPTTDKEEMLVLMRWEHIENFEAHCVAPHITEFVEKYNNILFLLNFYV